MLGPFYFNINAIEEIAKPSVLLGTMASRLHFSKRCGRAVSAPSGFAISSFVSYLKSLAASENPVFAGSASSG